VTLQPIRLKQIELTGIPTDIPLSTLDPHLKHCVSALRIRLECDETVTLNDMKLDQLVFFLAGPDQQAVQLLELLMQHNIGVVYQTVEEQPQRWLLAKESLRQEGFEPEQALLPSDQRNFEGYRLLQEYFAFPARFQFFSVNGLPRQLNNKSALRQFEIVVLLDSQSEFLERVVDINHLALHCTPVINLFPKVTERI
ncbi:type VI secretion system baseplate subunit TssF, partial [Yersinia bercovieri]|uniref:type VI secretion system baseplate subunit TssF n=1 Tax=Yersinia bercovieri TaxID=634 RepID=UPI0011A0EF80